MVVKKLAAGVPPRFDALLAVVALVAVAALPLILPEMVLVKVFVPAMVWALTRST